MRGRRASMIRYWKIGLLVPFILVSIGLYYLNTASGSFPDYYIKYQSGDEKEASLVSLGANYTDQSLTIRAEGSEYWSDLSFWETLAFRAYRSPVMEKLQQEHRHFMRGKNNQGALYQDEQVLGYVALDEKADAQNRNTDYQLVVSIYDKKDKSSDSFKVSVPMGGKFPIIRISDVQIIERKLKLTTENTKDEGSKTEQNIFPEIHIYTLDLDKRMVESDKVILSGSSSDPDVSVGIEVIYESNPTVKRNYLVLQKRYFRQGKDEKQTNVIFKKELFYYDYAKDELSPIKDKAFDAIYQKENHLRFWHVKDTIWISDMSDPKQGRLFHYNLAEKGEFKELVIDTKNLQLKGELRDSLIIDNRLYMQGSIQYDTAGGVPALVIADLNDGKILYEGYISRKDNLAISNLMLGGVSIP